MGLVLESRSNPGVVAMVGIPLSLRTPLLLKAYSWRYMDGIPAEKAKIPPIAPCLDTAPAAAVGDDGMLRVLAEDGSTVVAGKVVGKDGSNAVLPASMADIATTDKNGRAVLDWSALKLKARPSAWSLGVIGKPLAWSFETDPTATGATIALIAEKPTALLSVNVAVAGGQPAVGVRVFWSVTA